MMKKVDFKDLTFLIPVRLDSIIRLENLLASIDSINETFDTNVYLLESCSYKNKLLERILPNNVKYVFIEDKDPIFYRTYYLNYMVYNVQTDYLAIWDADVIIDAKQLIEAINALRNHDYDVAFPYNGYFYDTSEIIREIYLVTKDKAVLFNNINKMLLPYGHNTTGGAILLNRKSYINAGMENENFYGWVPEDVERYVRWKNLGYKIFRSKGPLFHLTHPRDINGRYNSDLQKKNGFYYLREMANCSAAEIQKIVTSESFRSL